MIRNKVSSFELPNHVLIVQPLYSTKGNVTYLIFMKKYQRLALLTAGTVLSCVAVMETTPVKAATFTFAQGGFLVVRLLRVALQVSPIQMG